MNQRTCSVAIVANDEDLIAARVLMLEYAQSLQLNVCFRSVEKALALLPGEFAQPGGGLWLAKSDDQVAIGVVALRSAEMDKESPAAIMLEKCAVGEVKRLYVAPNGRGMRAAEKLLQALFEQAVMQGYRTLVLDTRESMIPAITLYKKLGFSAITRYNNNPDAQLFFYKVL